MASRDHHFLVEAAEERLLANAARTRARQTRDDFFAPQVESKWLERCQQRSPKITKRLPPSGQSIIDDNDFASGPHHTTKLPHRLLAITARLLVEEEEHKRLIVVGIRQLQV